MEALRIHVVQLSGHPVEIVLVASDSVVLVEQKIYEKLGFWPSKLVLHGKIMHRSLTLTAAGVVDGDTILAVKEDSSP